MDRSFIAFGDSGDVRQFIRIIRAFALAGRLGERLTIVGCAQKRRKLAKWTEALRIGGVTVFADAEDRDLWVCDPRTVIIFARLHKGHEHRLLDALSNGVPVVALGCDRRSSLFGRYAPIIDLPTSDDVVGLSHVMLTVCRNKSHSGTSAAPRAVGQEAFI